MQGSVADFDTKKLNAIASDIASNLHLTASVISVSLQAGSVVLIVRLPKAAVRQLTELVSLGKLPRLGGVKVLSAKPAFNSSKLEKKGLGSLGERAHQAELDSAILMGNAEVQIERNFKAAAKLARERMSEYYQDVYLPKIKNLEEEAAQNYAFAESSLDKPISNANAAATQERAEIKARAAKVPAILSEGRARAAAILAAAKLKAKQTIEAAEAQITKILRITRAPTATPSTGTPTAAPSTATPTVLPTIVPTLAPTTAIPTVAPTIAPTTYAPTHVPTPSK